MKRWIHNLVIVALLAAGAVLFAFMDWHAGQFSLALVGRTKSVVDDDALIQRIVLLVAVILTLVPLTRRPIGRLFDFLRQRSTDTRRKTALAIALLSGPLLFGLGAIRGRLMLPIWHDENMYRMQTTFLAHGKLCMPGLDPRIADSFDTPYVFVHGVYAPVYFPGTALLHVPAAWLHLPYWLTPLLIATVSLTLLYLIVAELIDGLAGLMAVILMVSLLTFRWLALVEMSHAAGMMWGLVALWAWLNGASRSGAVPGRTPVILTYAEGSGQLAKSTRSFGVPQDDTLVRLAPGYSGWGSGRKLGWVFLAALAAGFYAITRPLDAICVLLPVALAWIWDLRRERWGARIATVSVVLVTVAPLIGLQLAFDRAVTGHLLQTPLDLYNKVYFNAKSIGLEQYDPAFRPPTPVPQIQKLYRDLDRPQIIEFTTARSAASQWITNRIPLTLGAATPTIYLLILLPVALAGLTDTRRWVFWSMSGCYLIGAAFFYIFLAQYTIAAAPAILFAVVLAVSVIYRALPRFAGATVFVPLAVLLLGMEYIAVNQQNYFEPIPLPGAGAGSPGWVSRFNYRNIPQWVQTPALVFYRFDDKEEPWEEPVYNWGVLNPDEASIIRVHDLGPKQNLAVLRYYQDRQPDRHVYFFDRRSLRQPQRHTLKEASQDMEMLLSSPQ